MRYTSVLFFLLLAGNCPVYAQITDSVFFEQSDNTTTIAQEGAGVNPSSLKNTKAYASERITVRKFDESKWKKIVGATDYDESQKPEKKIEKTESEKSEGSKTGKRAFERNDDDREFEETSASEPMTISPLVALIMKVVFYAIVIAIIGFILYYILKNISFKREIKHGKIGAPDFTEHVEDIAALDVDSLLKKTLAAGDFRLAIRMYFLGLLKKLNEGGFIIWKKDKTNRDYLNELLSRAHYFDEVRKLTLAYEQVWYGDHTLPPESYEKLIADFKAMDKKLLNSKAQ